MFSQSCILCRRNRSTTTNYGLITKLLRTIAIISSTISFGSCSIFNNPLLRHLVRISINKDDNAVVGDDTNRFRPSDDDRNITDTEDNGEAESSELNEISSMRQQGKRNPLFVTVLSQLSSIIEGPADQNNYNRPPAYGGYPSNELSIAPLLLRIIMLMVLSSNLSDTKNKCYIQPVQQHYTFERLNDRYIKDKMAFMNALSPPSRKLWRKFRPRRNKQKSPNASTAIILEFRPGVATSSSSSSSSFDNDIEELRDKVSFLLDYYHTHNHKNNPNPQPMEVILLLESPGGAVQDYALAASQISRLRSTTSTSTSIKVTICVDRIAASGGYMIACQSSPSSLLAAPFAIVGSIGVIGEVMNVHEILKRWGVKPIVMKAGKKKAPVGMIAEVTKEELGMMREQMELIHGAFKEMVFEGRRGRISEEVMESVVGTGDVWIGRDALEVGLVDRLVTSDEYIAERMREGDCVLRLMKYERMGLWGVTRGLSPFDFLFLKDAAAKISCSVSSFKERMLRMLELFKADEATMANVLAIFNKAFRATYGF